MLAERALVVAEPRMRYSSSKPKIRKKSKNLSRETMIVFMVFATLIMAVTALAVAAFGTDKETVEPKAAEPKIETIQTEEQQQVVPIDTNSGGIITADYREYTATPEPKVQQYTDEEVYAIAKTVYGEALVTGSDTEMAAVVWCILNRVDSSLYPNSIIGVVTQNRQFHGYNESNPVTEHIEWLVRDVLDRWYEEKETGVSLGRILPSNYLYFDGDGKHNHFRTEWNSNLEWDWSINSPYED